MASVLEDGGIGDRLVRAVDDEVMRTYGLKELTVSSENKHRHIYTCLEAPDELKVFGLTHIVCREDNRTHVTAALDSGAAASRICDQLNGFTEQDLLGEDDADRELREANELAAKRESVQQPVPLSGQALVDKIAAAQAAR